MKPWLTAIGASAKAKAPIVAREVIRIEPVGYSDDEHVRRPVSEMVREVLSKEGPGRPVTSVGVAQLTSPPQYSGCLVLGVPPPLMLARSAKVWSDIGVPRTDSRKRFVASSSAVLASLVLAAILSSRAPSLSFRDSGFYGACLLSELERFPL
jgi:hypothetical protein